MTRNASHRRVVFVVVLPARVSATRSGEIDNVCAMKKVHVEFKNNNDDIDNDASTRSVEIGNDG